MPSKNDRNQIKPMHCGKHYIVPGICPETQRNIFVAAHLKRDVMGRKKVSGFRVLAKKKLANTTPAVFMTKKTVGPEPIVINGVTWVAPRNRVKQPAVTHVFQAIYSGKPGTPFIWVNYYNS